MEQLITVTVSVLCTILSAVGSLVIAYLHKKTRELEKDKKDLGAKVDALHNGFRQEVHTKICKLGEQVEDRIQMATVYCLQRPIAMVSKQYDRYLRGEEVNRSELGIALSALTTYFLSI